MYFTNELNGSDCVFRNLRNPCEGIRFHTAKPTEPGRALSAEGMLVAGSNERLYEIMSDLKDLL